jgi:L-arabinose transport system ATP-binding protein
MNTLTFDSVSMGFAGVQALSCVTFAVSPGSVHALLGENGAGKSTLLKVLGGVYRPTEGCLRIDGAPAVFENPRESIAAGVAIIYQELHLVPELSVAENVLLGHMSARVGVIDRRGMRAEARRILASLGEPIDPDTKVSALSIAQRQVVEIAKALSRGARIIAFDEPTSSLTAHEAGRLFEVIRGLRKQGCTVLYVSHRLEEIMSVCDAATVLRDGRLVATFETLGGGGVTRDELIQCMVGRDIRDVYGTRRSAPGATILEVEGISGPGLAEPASLTVRDGEIVGMFGLVGAGRSELLRLIYGAGRPAAGNIRVNGVPLRFQSPRDAIESGVLLCPEDRKKEGIIPARSVLENINIGARRHAAAMGLLIRKGWERRNAAEQIARLGIKARSCDQLMRELSGGNQQKVILARLLSERVRVLMLDEPTRGIDVGAKGEIYAIMNEMAARGAGILMASSELPEVLGMSDRILVMRQGRLVGELPRAEANEERLLGLALPRAA